MSWASCLSQGQTRVARSPGLSGIPFRSRITPLRGGGGRQVSKALRSLTRATRARPQLLRGVTRTMARAASPCAGGARALGVHTGRRRPVHSDC
jgi:hypothetical protein